MAVSIDLRHIDVLGRTGLFDLKDREKMRVDREPEAKRDILIVRRASKESLF